MKAACSRRASAALDPTGAAPPKALRRLAGTPAAARSRDPRWSACDVTLVVGHQGAIEREPAALRRAPQSARSPISATARARCSLWTLRHLLAAREPVRYGGLAYAA